MNVEENSDTLMLNARGPVGRVETLEEGSKHVSDIDGEIEWWAETTTEGFQELSISLPPTSDLEKYVDSPHGGAKEDIIYWIFANHLEDSEEGWDPIIPEEWEIELTTKKPGDDPENLFKLCAEKRADEEGKDSIDILKEWKDLKYFDNKRLQACIESI